MKKRSSVIAWTLAAVLALSNLSPAAVYAAETEAANAAAAATEEVSAEEEARAAEALAAQENDEEEASPAGTTDTGSDEVSALDESAEEAVADDAGTDAETDAEVDSDEAIDADASDENTDSEDETVEEADSAEAANDEAEDGAESATNDNEVADVDAIDEATDADSEADDAASTDADTAAEAITDPKAVPAATNQPTTDQPTQDQPTPEQPVVEPVDAMEIIYSDGITDGSGRDAKSAGTTNVDVDEILGLEVIETDVSSASDGCILAGVPGKYVADAQAALDRINEIRREACEEGVLNPDTNMPLTMDDYVEIKWSNDLEYIARIRAAESAFTGAHSRANGEDCWGISSPSGVRSYGEVLAWNWSESVIQGINQWYGEKADWVNQTQGAVTGHYTQMIDPTNTYVGLGTFCCDSVRYYNTTAGEFSGRSGLDETPMSMMGDCLQMIEFATSNLSGTSKIIGKMTGSKGETGNLLLATGTSCKFASTDVYLLDGVTWSSSNTSVVTVSSDGMTKVVGGGTSTITASAAGGSVQAAAEFTVKLIEDCDIAIAQSTYTYDGQEKKPAVTVTYNGAALTQGTDYTVLYANNTNAGTATVTITGAGEFQGEAERSFTIKKATQTVTAEPRMRVLGVNLTTPITVSGIGTITYKSSDTSVIKVDSSGWMEGVGEGTATITVTASGDKNHESGSASFEVTVASVYEVESGSCGENATWTYYNNGEVRIHGTGTVELVRNSSGDYLWDKYYTPDEVWGYEKVETVYVEEGITAIGSEVFSVRSSNGIGKMSDSPRIVELADSVKTIDKMAFFNCQNLESVSIGSGLTSIGEDAFTYCPSLKEIKVSSENNSFKTQDGVLYSKDGSVLVKMPNDGRTEFAIPDGVVTLGIGAISDLDALKTLSIPKSVLTIREYALDGSNGITDIYYGYSPSRWNLITIGGYNDVLKSANIHYEVADTPISNCTITLGQSAFTYDGKAKQPKVTVTYNDTVLTEGVNYTVSYGNNVNAGTATVTVKGNVDYEGETAANFTIGKANQTFGASAAAAAICVGKTTTVRTSGSKGIVTWKSADPTIISVSGTTLKGLKTGIVKLTATASGDANYNPAAASITVAVLPGATGKITTTNLSKGIKVTWAKVAGANGYFIYRNGSLVKSISSGTTVSFSDTAANTNGKKYVYKVVAKASTGKSTLSKSLTTYRVSRPAIKSLKNSASKKMTVKWGKNSKASGYIVQYGLKSSFKGAKTVTLSKATLISKTIAKLTKGKVYYVRVRAFKKVGSKKYYSAWSAAKKVKISK